MPTVTLRYRLPDEQADFERARLGSEAISSLCDIDHKLRSLLKYGEPTEPERTLAETIRAMIPADLLEL